MTLLVVSPDYASHVLPLATLATAWREAGERVVVATGPAVADVVASFGFERVDLRLGRGSNPGVIRAEQQPPGEDHSLRGFFAATHHGMVATMSYQAGARRDDLLWEPVATAQHVLGIVEAVQPDHVLVDHLAFSASLALRAGDVPYGDVVLGHPCALPVGDEVYGFPTAWPTCFAPDEAELAGLHQRCSEVRDAFTAHWNAALAALAPAAAPVEDAFAAHGPVVLLNYPETLHEPGRTPQLPAHVFLGASIRNEQVPDDVAEWLDTDDPRPLVYVSFGSFLSARQDVLARVVAALGPMPVRVVLAHGSADPDALGTCPDAWLVREFVPQVAMLQHASVAVTHGGNNSITEALAAGVALVVLPFSTDQFAGAAAVERTGLGTALDPNTATVGDLRGAIERLLGGEALTNAAAIGHRLRADPGPARALRALTGSTPAQVAR